MRLTPQLAEQVCERGHGDVLIEGAITRQGVSAYTLEMTASDCKKGRVLFSERAEPKNIDEVLTTLAKIAAATRSRLSGNAGDTSTGPAALPTSSVQALKAYTTGLELLHSQPAQSAALLEQATQFDPISRTPGRIWQLLTIYWGRNKGKTLISSARSI